MDKAAFRAGDSRSLVSAEALCVTIDWFFLLALIGCCQSQMWHRFMPGTYIGEGPLGLMHKTLDFYCEDCGFESRRGTSRLLDVPQPQQCSKQANKQ